MEAKDENKGIPTGHIGIELFENLKKSHPRKSDIGPELYENPPFLPKKFWTEIGNEVVQKERISLFNVPGEKWISLRLDGHGFSNLTKKLRKDGIIGMSLMKL
jgi:hypothetical protein